MRHFKSVHRSLLAALISVVAVAGGAVLLSGSASAGPAQAVRPTSCGGLAITVDLSSGELPTALSDVILGTAGDDQIAGGDGDDVICGAGGNDRIWGQGGNDTIYGDDGDDYLRGGDGIDFVSGGNGDDNIAGGRDDDILTGDGGADKVRGGTGNDQVHGGEGDDTQLSGNGGEDFVFGGPGNDALITGGPRPDELWGGSGNDSLKGHKGADIVYGNEGDDVLAGGPQDDLLDGGTETDECYGGEGDDTESNCEFVPTPPPVEYCFGTTTPVVDGLPNGGCDVTPTPVAPTPTPAAPVTPTPVPATPGPSTPVPATPVPATPVPATPVPATPVPATPTPSSLTPLIIGQGDSRTSNVSYASIVGGSVAGGEYVDLGRPGGRTSDMLGSSQGICDRLNSTKKGVVLLSGGYNDVVDKTAAATIYANLSTMVSDYKACGYFVIISTQIKAGPSIFGDLRNGIMADLNSQILSNSAGADRVVDIASELDDPLNTTYFSSDTIHLTQAGRQLWADRVIPLLPF